MKELLDGISVERLEFYANNEPPFGYTGSDIQTMARIALAVKQAKPVAKIPGFRSKDMNDGYSPNAFAWNVGIDECAEMLKEQGYQVEHVEGFFGVLTEKPAPVVPDLSSIKRYDLDQSNCDSCGQDCGADMSDEPDGDYVLFADVVSLLTSAPESGQ